MADQSTWDDLADGPGSPPGPGTSPRPRLDPVVDLRSGRAIGWEADDVDGRSVLAALGHGGAPPDGGLVFVRVRADDVGDPTLVDDCRRVGAPVVIDVRDADPLRLDALSPRLDDLAAAGVHLSIESTSTLSLAMIARIQPSFVKLDPPLVRDVVHDHATRSVVRAFVAFAEHEDIHLIAEGVERAEQVDALRDLGVVLARGPLFGGSSGDWSPPRIRRRRPRIELDPSRRLADRLALARDLQEVADAVCAELARPDAGVAVYVEREGLLRCVAQRGQTQVVDGIPLRQGPLADAFRSGSTVVEAHGRGDRALGTRAANELAVPVRVAGRVVGVIAVAADGEVGTAEVTRIEDVAGVAAARLAEVGVGRRDSGLRRLAQATIELSALGDPEQVELAACRLACTVSGLSSALFVVPAEDGLVLRSVQGPLTDELRSLSTQVMAELLAELGPASSCLSAGDDGRMSSMIRLLRNAGASTVAAFPVRSTERGVGLLLLADHAPVELELELREALEILAREIGRSLDLAVVMADLRVRATIDPLTQLGNLAAFQEALSAVGGRRRGRWAVVMADVDGLKAVNDTHGHLAGDFALKAMAEAVSGVLRSEDRLYRIGGDEFAGLLHDVDAEGAAEIGRRMCEAAAGVMGEYGAGLSVGIALPEPGEPSATFLDRADKVLYEVKRSGRGNAKVAPPRS